VNHLVPNQAYRLEVNRTGLSRNDAYSAYIEMGSPKTLLRTSCASKRLDARLPETDKVVQQAEGKLSIDSDEQQRHLLVRVTRSRKQIEEALRRGDKRRAKHLMYGTKLRALSGQVWKSYLNGC